MWPIAIGIVIAIAVREEVQRRKAAGVKAALDAYNAKLAALARAVGSGPPEGKP